MPRGRPRSSGRRLLAGNGDVRIGYAATDRPSEALPQLHGDDCVYIKSGRARFESMSRRAWRSARATTW